jgi:hypothetical protein
MPNSRDAAYHQGTVWPWLLGHYADALLHTAWDMNGAVQGLLDMVTPLFCQHLCEAGLGSISEVFDGSPPYSPRRLHGAGLERGRVPAHAQKSAKGRARCHTLNGSKGWPIVWPIPHPATLPACAGQP